MSNVNDSFTWEEIDRALEDATLDLESRLNEHDDNEKYIKDNILFIGDVLRLNLSIYLRKNKGII